MNVVIDGVEYTPSNEKSTPAWNYFVVNKYVNWLGDVPQEIKRKFKFKPTLPLQIIDGMLVTGKTHQEEAWARYGNRLSQRKGSDRIRIKHGAEFKLLADMIEDGILPFSPNPVAQEDLREPSGKSQESSREEEEGGD